MEEDYNSLLHFTSMDYHTTNDSQVFSVAVTSEVSTGITGQMQTPDCLHSYMATTGLKTVASTGGMKVTVTCSQLHTTLQLLGSGKSISNTDNT